MEYKFTVSGTPIAKARPKFRMVTTKMGKTFGTAYTPKKSVNFETSVHMAFTVTHGAVVPTELGVKLFIRAYFLPPKAAPKYKKKEIEQGLVPVLKKPDIDNVAKSVLDALNTIVYTDDKLVYRLSVEKFYSFRPRTEVVVITEEELKEEPLPF